MGEEPVQNTLFIGNGFSRAVFQEVPSWEEIFRKKDESLRDIKNLTFLYEASRLKPDQKGASKPQVKSEDQVKEELIEQIRVFSDALNCNVVKHLDGFGDLLCSHNIHDIITTNYDNGIEHILLDACGYDTHGPENLLVERIYNIRTYKLFHHNKTGYQVRLWKIHGDLERTKSITLGFDQYCGTLSKIESYVKGTYCSTRGEPSSKCKGSILDKCRNSKPFDHISWVELFFRTNVYIVGFGMDFSEIDIWWLLNKRARLKLEAPEIQNSITFLYNEDYESKESKPELFAVLDAFQIAYAPIASGPDYLTNVSQCITEKEKTCNAADHDPR